jgi:hypothetical protein
MEEVIEKLKELDNLYEKDIPKTYIEGIREIWCDMQNEVEAYTQNDEEEYPIEEPSYGYSYEQYLREVR